VRGRSTPPAGIECHRPRPAYPGARRPMLAPPTLPAHPGYPAPLPYPMSTSPVHSAPGPDRLDRGVRDGWGVLHCFRRLPPVLPARRRGSVSTSPLMATGLGIFSVALGARGRRGGQTVPADGQPVLSPHGAGARRSGRGGTPGLTVCRSGGRCLGGQTG